MTDPRGAAPRPDDHDDARRPALAPRARMRRDDVRGRTVLLAPEAVVALTPTAAEVLARCDGVRTEGEIVADLARRYPGAPVARDVASLLARLRGRGLVVDGSGAAAVAPVATAREGRARRDVAREPGIDPPEALVAELTYRCPLRCGYCSNPVDLGRYRDELDAAAWARVIDDAADAGALHLHLSGGEPLVRDDLEGVVAAGARAGLYVNLITSAYGLDDARLDALARAGVDHVQVSLQDTDAPRGDAIAGVAIHEHKLRAARAVRERGLALSINVVLHRGNVARAAELVALAADLGAARIELANAQYHGWALRNRDALLPSREALLRARDDVDAMRPRLAGRMDVLFVLPDYYTDAPKPCMDGWGRRFVVVAPDGTILPCAGAHALPLPFDNARVASLADAWYRGAAFNAYRGTGWMREPCASCPEREVDHGGCRCQAFALAGDAREADPACRLSPHHAQVVAAREAPSREPPAVLYRVRTKHRGDAPADG